MPALIKESGGHAGNAKARGLVHAGLHGAPAFRAKAGTLTEYADLERLAAEVIQANTL